MNTDKFQPGQIVSLKMVGSSVEGMKVKVLRRCKISGDYVVACQEERRSNSDFRKDVVWKVGDIVQVHSYEMREL